MIALVRDPVRRGAVDDGAQVFAVVIRAVFDAIELLLEIARDRGELAPIPLFGRGKAGNE